MNFDKLKCKGGHIGEQIDLVIHHLVWQCSHGHDWPMSMGVVSTYAQFEQKAYAQPRAHMQPLFRCDEGAGA